MKREREEMDLDEKNIKIYLAIHVDFCARFTESLEGENSNKDLYTFLSDARIIVIISHPWKEKPICFDLLC